MRNRIGSVSFISASIPASVSSDCPAMSCDKMGVDGLCVSGVHVL